MRNTLLYRLKSHSGLVEKILWLLALGVDASALEEKFGMREVTIRSWLRRSGMQGKKLPERFPAELILIHVQLDELWANVKNGSQDMWLWVAHDAKTKLIPVLQVGRCYYHFVRPHQSLAVVLSKPALRKGKQTPRKYRKQTPAQAAGLTDRIWTVRDLLLYPLL